MCAGNVRPGAEPPATADNEDLHGKIRELETVVSRLEKNLDGAFETIATLLDDTARNSEAAAKNAADIIAARDYASGANDALQDSLSKLSESVAEIERRWVVETTERVMADQRLRRSFSALADKEWLDRVEKELTSRAGELSAPTDTKADLSSASAWSEWANSYGEWDSLLHEYVLVAVRYVSNANDILAVDDSLYGDSWNVEDSQFPDSEGVRRYKKFRILLSQWGACRRAVNLNVRQAAIEGIFLDDR
jgi:hypothetical protein